MYRESAPSSLLQRRVVCVWRHEPQGAAHDSAVTIVPDGCVDIVWTGRALRIAGPDTRPVLEPLDALTQVAGIRFHPGAANGVLGIPTSALCDTRVALEELWGDEARRLHDALHHAPPELVRTLLQDALLARRASWTAVDPMIQALVTRLRFAGAGPDLRLSALARELGSSERQLHRRCASAVGYGPQLLARILRVQRVRKALRSAPHTSLAALASQHGYADQAHLAHDTAQLFGTTPSRMRSEALASATKKRASHQMSDFDKP